MKRQVAWLSLSILVAVSCGKKEEDKAGSKTPDGDKEKGSANKTPESPKAASGPFGNFDAKAVEAKLQGAWVIPSGLQTLAWNVEGTKITQHSAGKDDTLELAVESPCSVKSVKKEGGGTSSTTHRFVWEGDVMWMGGDLGVRTGDTTIACISSDIFVLKAGKCQRMDNSFGEWKPKDGECRIEKEGDAEQFVAKVHGREVKVAFSGDVLKSSAAKKVEKKASWDEAKAAVAK